MTDRLDTASDLAALAAAPETATLPALWAALAPEDRRQALGLALRGNPGLRRQLVELLRKTPRYRAFRPTAFSGWTAEQFADAFRNPASVPLDVQQGCLIALHIEGRSELLAAFLDALGVAHQAGMIEESPDPAQVTAEKLAPAADALAARFPREQVTVYFLTLLVLEPEVWGGLAPWLARQR